MDGRDQHKEQGSTIIRGDKKDYGAGDLLSAKVIGYRLPIFSRCNARTYLLVYIYT
jgi:hypothetical protein